MDGGFNGGNGANYGDNDDFLGGKGSGFHLNSEPMEFTQNVAAGAGGEGDLNYGGGGGGGVLIDGQGPVGLVGVGEGYGGGGSGYNESSLGLPGVVLMRIIKENDE